MYVHICTYVHTDTNIYTDKYVDMYLKRPVRVEQGAHAAWEYAALCPQRQDARVLCGVEYSVVSSTLWCVVLCGVSYCVVCRTLWCVVQCGVSSALSEANCCQQGPHPQRTSCITPHKTPHTRHTPTPFRSKSAPPPMIAQSVPPPVQLA